MYLALQGFGESIRTWKPLEFEPTLSRCLKIIDRARKRRGDYFCIIKSEYVSDIENHMEFFAVATSRKKYTRMPRVVAAYPGVSDMNWFDWYERRGEVGILMTASKHMDRRMIAAYVYRLLQETFPYVKDKPYSKYFFESFRKMREWVLNGTDFELVTLDTRGGVEYLLFMVSHLRDGIVDPSTMGSMDSFYEAIACAINGLRLAGQDFDEIFTRLSRSMISLNRLLLAKAEDGKIGLELDLMDPQSEGDLR